ncbi:MAG: hypothetical protein H6R10_1866 [Rhodocyclaceae bacterium]|nr:hypothetical protein [Rhodocyclaceae bacterium]
MRFFPRQALAGLVCLLPLALHATNGQDRAYRVVSGGLPLVQVFDDGRKTYLQLAGSTDRKLREAIVKSIVVSRDGKDSPASLEASSPYLTIAGVYDRIAIAAGGRRAVAIYLGGGRGTSPALEPATTGNAPVKASNSSASSAAPVVKEGTAIQEIGQKTDREPAGSGSEPEIAHYKVVVPFAPDKVTLGKEGQKAVQEIAHMGRIAHAVVIRVPGAPGGDFQLSHGRAAEIHRVLVKAGLVRQRFVIDVVDALPDGKSPIAEVTLMIELAPAPQDKH